MAMRGRGIRGGRVREKPPSKTAACEFSGHLCFFEAPSTLQLTHRVSSGPDVLCWERGEDMPREGAGSDCGARMASWCPFMQLFEPSKITERGVILPLGNGLSLPKYLSITR